jgi:vacuolar-type H+-ATPase subunit E/Vma4
MALAELLRSLENDTAAEVRAITAAGAGEAARIESDAARARSERVAGAIAAFADERRAAADAELAAVIRGARAEVLAARAAMIDRIRGAVLDELPGLLAGDPELGQALVSAALACVGDESGILRCTPLLADPARASAPPAIRVEIESSVATGVVIELATGTRIDATLATLLERAWPALACEALTLERAR